ncbi:MAG: phosphotransferase [Lachnospiraceae bacterium]|nr:phosphotransferase [Lachnospiraceae bacterium]
MFTITKNDINSILRDYRINAECSSLTELQRYYYEKEDPTSKQVRVIVRVDLVDGRSLVVRFKNEDDAPQDVIEAQSRFAVLLYEHGIDTPEIYDAEGLYARCYTINGYDVIVTVERFEEGEIQLVDPETAMEIGKLLARMHNIAEEGDIHVNSKVLFDPLTENDLFSFETFIAYKDKLLAIDHDLYLDIVHKHNWLISHIQPFNNNPRYAVQGDFSDCNLYRTQSGKIGVFDFNRCGDSNLFFDAVMQAIFVARLMDYPEELAGHQEERILSAFLNGYQQIRPFTSEQKEVYRYLYTLVNAFWGADLVWSNQSLTSALENADDISTHRWMKEIYRRESECLDIAFLK